MRLTTPLANWLAVLAVSSCLVPAGWAQAKPAQKQTKKAKEVAAAPATPAVEGTGAEAAAPETSEAIANKRDPFLPLIAEKKEGGGGGEHLPPGKAGLVIATVRVDGTAKSPGGMIAVVSNPDQRVYFVREGDRLYDGDVEKINLDGVTFRENSKDAFGKPVERVVTKRIYVSAGEQQ
jgi:Tfp pilus assembly protein PilP